MKHNYLEINQVNEREYIVKNELSNKYVKLGASETSFLLEVLGIQSPMELNIDTKLSFNLNNEAKELLMQKFDEWGFLQEDSEVNKKRKKIQNVSHIPLVDIEPTKVLNKVCPIIRPLFTVWGVIAINVLAVINIVLALLKIENVYSSITQIGSLKGLDIILMMIAIILTIVLHELGHATVCSKYGGKISRMGIVLFFFFPCFYCDVSDIYLFKKRREAAFVALSGVYINFVLANIVLGVYFLLLIKGIEVSGLVYYYLLNIGIIIYNLMPLVKMDGYWFVAALAGVNNLMDKSILIFMAMLFRKQDFKNIQVNEDKKILLALYGGAAFIFYPLFWSICLKGLCNKIIAFIPRYGMAIVIMLILIIIWDVARRTLYYINLYKKESNRIFSFI
nr:M50 family metallopeptidase [uncultured Cellulosilyticum sp.]